MTMYDNRTPAGRARLDAAVQKKLGKRGRTRGDIATALGNGATPRMVTDSLRRLVASKKAERTGPPRAPLYMTPQTPGDSSEWSLHIAGHVITGGILATDTLPMVTTNISTAITAAFDSPYAGQPLFFELVRQRGGRR